MAHRPIFLPADRARGRLVPIWNNRHHPVGSRAMRNQRASAQRRARCAFYQKCFHELTRRPMVGRFTILPSTRRCPRAGSRSSRRAQEWILIGARPDRCRTFSALSWHPALRASPPHREANRPIAGSRRGAGASPTGSLRPRRRA